MIKGLLKDSLVYGAANGIQKLVPLFLVPVTIHYLGQEALKVYDVSFVYAFLLSWLIVLGQDNAAGVYYFDTTKTNFDKKQVLKYGMLVQLVSLFFAGIIIFPFRQSIGRVLFSNDASISEFWTLALLIIPGHVVFNYSLNILLWQKQKRKYVFLCLCQAILSLAGIFVSIILLNGTLKDLFFCIIGSTWICGVIGFFLTKSQMQTNAQYNPMLIKKLFLFGIPIALTSFLHQALPSADRFFLLNHGLEQQLPQYIVAVKLGGLLAMVISAFVLAFTPWSLNKLNEQDAEQDISNVFRIVAVAGFAMIPVLLCFKELMLQVFADTEFRVSANLLPFFFFGWVFDLFSYFSMLGIYKSQNSILILLFFAAGVVLLSALNIVLIPKVGVYGAALAFCISKAALFCAPLFFLRKHFKLSVHAPSFIVTGVLAALCCYFIYYTKWYLSFPMLVIMLLIAAYYFYQPSYKKIVASNL